MEFDKEKIFEYARKCIERDEQGDAHGCRGMSRRNFLKVTGAALAGSILPISALTSCDNTDHKNFRAGAKDDQTGGDDGQTDNNDDQSGNDDSGNTDNGQTDPGDQGGDITPPEEPAGISLVSMVRHSDVETMVRTAIDMAGGLNEIASGDTVVIKPNITAGFIPGTNYRVNTSKDIIAAVIRAVKTRTQARNITVAEASAFNLPTEFWAKQMGIYDVCVNEGANFMAWETGEYVTLNSEQFTHFDFSLRIPKSLTDGSFTHFINVPMLKNHDMVTGTDVDYTCCIKNHVGCIHPLVRIYGDEATTSSVLEIPTAQSGIHTSQLGEICAELNLAVPKHAMNIVDALTVVLKGGPASLYMTLEYPGLVLASKDRVACDSVAVAVLRHYAEVYQNRTGKTISRPYVNKSVWAQAQIRRAQELNLGQSKENIQVSHQGVENFEAIMAKWC